MKYFISAQTQRTRLVRSGAASSTLPNYQRRNAGCLVYPDYTYPAPCITSRLGATIGKTSSSSTKTGNSRFSRATQRNLSTTGHLFENQYHAVLVDVDSYFLELLRYIHLNPVRARIVETPHQYRWSSHRVYLAKTTQPWVHIDFGLSLFSKDPERARVLYEAFINDKTAPSRDPMEDVHPKERRVLGDDQFLQKLTIHSHNTTVRHNPRIYRDIRLPRSWPITRRRSIPQPRQTPQSRTRQHAHRAITQNIATLSQVARYLNRTTSALSHAVTRYRATGSK